VLRFSGGSNARTVLATRLQGGNPPTHSSSTDKDLASRGRGRIASRSDQPYQENSWEGHANAVKNMR